MRIGLWLACLLTIVATPVIAQTRGPFGPPWPEDTSPVHVHVPPSYTLLGGWGPAGGDATLVVHYPSMQPWSVSPAPGCTMWCDGKVLVVIETGKTSDLNRNTWQLRRERAEVATRIPKRETIVAIEPAPDGYTEAWENKRLDTPEMFGVPLLMRTYVRMSADDRPMEYVRCSSGNVNAQCTTQMNLDGFPAVHISITYGIQHWGDHAAIRSAVTSLVKSWL